MIRVNYLQESDSHRLCIAGHAGYDSSGRDIVCAGVSSITCALVNYLTHRAPEHVVEIHAASGEATIVCRRGDLPDAAFDMAQIGYLQFQANYPQYVEVYIASDGG